MGNIFNYINSSGLYFFNPAKFMVFFIFRMYTEAPFNH